MTKKTRRILFAILIILFLLLAPAVVLYSWGYRFNFQTNRISQTGAFYFKVFPKSVQISLTPLNGKNQTGPNGRQTKKTDFFFGAAYLENLLPQKYEVEIKKDGFYPWKKTLEIKEKQVTDAKNVVLVPEKTASSSLSKGVTDLFLSPDEKSLVWQETASDGWSLKLLELEKNVKSQLLGKKDLPGTNVSVLDLKFSTENQKILLKAGSKKDFKYYLIGLEKSPPDFVSLDWLGKNVEEVFFNPADNQKLFLLKSGKISSADLTQKKVSQALLENVNSFLILGRNVYYFLDSGPDAGSLFRTDLSFSGREKINGTAFPVQEGKNYRIYLFFDQVFLQDDQNLFLLNNDSGSFEKFFETNQAPVISPDFKKVAYYSDYEIWVLFLKDEFSQPQKSAGEKEFIVRFSEKIGKIYWLTANYLIFNSGSKIKVAEIDDRDKINIVDWQDLKEPEILWDNFVKKLFVLSESNVVSFNFSLH